jgi:hypothetical protein
MKYRIKRLYGHQFDGAARDCQLVAGYVYTSKAGKTTAAAAQSVKNLTAKCWYKPETRLDIFLPLYDGTSGNSH